ncbi:MOSC domain-containing protein [Actibacterium sp. 188UL27-1]|uniref:MOSC domain-containing protein n=1 Tax=Actibacterium sp. 188UL27-1 TaxID=2786961 RepID=UPI001959D185|nr:MOSC domain-containing protein [Actibacterium sp. 188UL27-1]MBM7067127.1 MOSC domain-containing protein [Actibacterium sp. 188UL27-1]
MRIVDIFRYPIKGLGHERLDEVDLAVGSALPGDRATAVSHGASAFDPAAPSWQPRRNFQVVANTPAYAAVTLARVDGNVRLSHPEVASVEVDLASDAGRAALADWMGALPGARPGPWHVAQLEGQAMTDMEPPYVSIHTHASLRALSEHLGVPPAPHRFRGNIWIEDAPPWAEEDWLGQEITLGTVRLNVVEPIGRCMAPSASPQTGARDVEVTKQLHAYRGRPNFGVYAEVIAGGTVAVGDAVEAPE